MNTIELKPPPEEPKVAREPAPEAPAPEAPAADLIDTTKMNKGQRDALELTEAARSTATARSFAADLFLGRLDTSRIYPFPEQSVEDEDAGRPFLSELARVLRDEVDSDRIDAEGEVPDAVIQRLAKLGAFGIKIPTRLGGLGLSQTNYCKAAIQLGGMDGNLTALLSAHQSIGVPQPLLVFGTEAQKTKYLPRIARGEISAFALTENDVGSDPARMTTSAEPTADGSHFVINGEKLWCTNGTKAGVIIVMARTPDKMVKGRARRQITAFIVEMDTPGVEVVRRCHFMGLRALYNGIIRFTNVRVPRENIVSGEGQGLKVALTTLNTGRLTLPAGCLGMMKRCLQYVREWSAEREQWGAPIGKHAAIAGKISRMAANLFATESMTLLTAALVDRDHADIRLEAALCKLWGSEKAWEAVDETMQIRGGRGYETTDSLRARGEDPIPVERMMRDCRINMIFEGSSEIMRLFLAREALDAHLQVAGAVLDSRRPLGTRAKAAFKAAGFYAKWYPRLWLPAGGVPAGLDPDLRRSMRVVAKGSQRLARSLFHAMVRHGPALEKQQLLLGRLVDIGMELFAISCVVLRADAMLKRNAPEYTREALLDLVRYFVAESEIRMQEGFAAVRTNTDRRGYTLAQDILAGKHSGLEAGMVK